MQSSLSGSELQAQKDRERDFLLLSPSLLVLYFFISAALIGLINHTEIWRALTQPLLGNSGGSGYSVITNPIFNFTNKLDTPLLIAFWGVIGGFFYAAVSFVEKIINLWRHHTTASQNLVGGQLPVRDYWQQKKKTGAYFAGGLVVWLVFMGSLERLILQWSSKLIVDGLYASSAFHQIEKVTFGLALNFLGFYIFIVLSKTVARLWRAINA